MSNPDTYRATVNVRLRCTRDPRLTGEAYDLPDDEVAGRATLDLDSVGEVSGVTVHDCTEWEASREPGTGRLVLFCQVDIEADTEEEALDALDEAAGWVPGYAIEEWSTVPAEIDAD